MKEKGIAAALAFFVGGFGFHHFYLGNTGRGIIYLVFFWAIIPSLVALVEGVTYLSMDQKAFDSKYNPNFLKEDFTKYDHLEKLSSLREKGVLTEDEYIREKNKHIA